MQYGPFLGTRYICGQEIEAANLTICESSIVAAEVICPGRFEYDDQLGDEILARIEALRDRAAVRSLARTNAALAPFAYRLESRFEANGFRITHDLYRKGEDEPLLVNLERVWPVSINA